LSSTELESRIGGALIAAQGGDRAAFAQFVGLTQGMVTALALSITSDPGISEDIAQETYLEAWKKLRSMHADASTLPWLREVARNKSIDVLRRRSHPATPVALDALTDIQCPLDQPPETLQSEQQIAIVLRALQSLSEESRETILLYYREGERTQDVATMLGVSDSVVRKRLQRARDKLRADVESQIKRFSIVTAPGAGFGAAIAAGLGSMSPPAAAVVIGAKSVLKAGISVAMKGLWAAIASVGVVVLAVAIDTRVYRARTRDLRVRRRLIVHGVVYAIVLGGYLLALEWAQSMSSRGIWVASLAALTVVLVFLLTFWRTHILR